ncbi:MAG: PIN domain-containing protein [Thermoanaerobaculia bacterium]
MTAIAYLDICCFKRPFDDATDVRVRREAEAVVAIFESVHRGSLELVRSPAHDFENERNPREDRRLATRLWLEAATVSVTSTSAIADHARALAALGFGPLDALHLAFAEASTARWFVTTDDRLLKLAARHAQKVRIAVLTPEQAANETTGDRQ